LEAQDGRIVYSRDVKFIEPAEETIIHDDWRVNEDYEQEEEDKDKDIREDLQKSGSLRIGKEDELEKEGENKDKGTNEPKGGKKNETSYSDEEGSTSSSSGSDYESCVDETEVNEVVEPRRSTRQKSYANAIIRKQTDIPSSYREAINSAEIGWKKAIEEEFRSLESLKTWELVELPKGRKMITSKWVFDEKLDNLGKRLKLKARLCARGFTQVEGIDYEETYSPVAGVTTLRMMLAICAAKGLSIRSFDVKSAFLNGKIKEEIFLKIPEGFEEYNGECGPNKCLKLNKGLYGLKQAARIWNDEFRKTLELAGMSASKHNSCLFYKWEKGKFIILVTHVDDAIIGSNDIGMAQEIIDKVKNKYEITEGNGEYFLNIEIRKTENKIMIRQKRYITEKIQCFKLEESRGCDTPMEQGFNAVKRDPTKEYAELSRLPYREIIGSLIFPMTHTRPDTAFAVGYLSRYVDNFRQEHWSAAKRVLKYLSRTQDEYLTYKSGNPAIELKCYVDADYAACKDTRKSVSGFVITIGESVISWRSKKQPVVALSTSEAEYIALSEGIRESVWIKGMLQELKLMKADDAIEVFEDNNACISIAENDGVSERVKHIDVKFHYIRDMVKRSEVKLMRIGTKDQIADVMTKALGKEKFKGFKALLGMQAGVSEMHSNDLDPGETEAVASMKASEATKPH